MIWFVSLLPAILHAADIVFTPNLDVYYGTKISVKCSIEDGMQITLIAPTAASNMRFSLSDPSCLLEKNGNYHTITTRLSGCNNDIYINSTTLTIVNRITNILAVGRQPVRLESRVGCLFHQQEISLGALTRAHIPVEIAPTAPPTAPSTGTDEEEKTVDKPKPRGPDGSPVDSTDETPVTPFDRKPTDPTLSADDLYNPVRPTGGSPDKPSPTDGSPDGSPNVIPPTDGSTDGSPDLTPGTDGSPDKTPDNVPLNPDGSSPDGSSPDGSSPVGPGAPVDQTDKTTPDGSSPDGSSPDGSSPDGSVPDGSSPDGSSPDGSVPDGSSPDGSLPDGSTPEGTSPDGSSPDGSSPDGSSPDGSTPDGSTPGGTSPDGSSPDGSSPDGSSPDGSSPDGSSPDGTSTPVVDPELDPELDNEWDPIDLTPRSFPGIGQCYGRRCKKSDKEKPWRSVASGQGVFFAKLMLYTDSSYVNSFDSPPMLRSDELIYAGVKLMGGPTGTAISISSCWASNAHHEAMEYPMRLFDYEITLPLINDGCATDYPPGLVNVLSNGESAMATFTSAMFKFVDYDTAHIYCRIRVCPMGPCPKELTIKTRVALL